MKKFSWIFALIMALSIGFIGCPTGGDDGDDGVEAGVKTVPVTGVSLSETALTMQVNDTETLVVTVIPSSATNKAVTWETNDSAVATVNNGVVTAVAAGFATITVTSVENEDAYAVCNVIVEDSSLSDLEGVVQLDKLRAVINEEITATYTGTELVSFQWKKDGQNVGTASTTNPNRFTPTEKGDYNVVVSLTGYNLGQSSVVVVTETKDAVPQIDVLFGEGAGQVEIENVMNNGTKPGTVGYLPDGSGYTFKYDTLGYQNVILRFTLKLEDDVQLSDYSKVTFTWKADGKSYPDEDVLEEQKADNGKFAQDVNTDKKIFLLSTKSAAFITPNPSWDNERPVYSYVTSTDFFTLGDNATSKRIWDGPDTKAKAQTAGARGWTPTVHGIEDVHVELPIIGDLAEMSGEIIFAIYVHVIAGGGSYTVSNVKFIPKDVDSEVNDTIRGPDPVTYKKPQAPGVDKSFNLNIDMAHVVTEGVYSGVGTPSAGEEGGVDCEFEEGSSGKRLVFALTEEQIAIVQSRVNGTFKVDLTATIVDGTGDAFRYHIGDIEESGGWNAIASPAEGALASITGEKLLAEDGAGTEKDNNGKYSSRPKYFIIQHRTAGAVTINVTSVKITVQVDAKAPDAFLEATGKQKVLVADEDFIGFYGSGNHKEVHSVITVAGNGGFWIAFPEGATAADTIVVKYVCYAADDEDPDQAVGFYKKQVNGWTDLDPADYNAFVPGTAVATLEIDLAKFSEAGITEGKAYFQTKKDGAVATIKIISVELKD
jgi:hypothetical protein